MAAGHVSCALRGDAPDTRVSGAFASLRSEQGAYRPLRRYAAIPRPLTELNIVQRAALPLRAKRLFYILQSKFKEVKNDEQIT